MILAIDFDGVIVEDKYPEIGKPLPVAYRIINRLVEQDHTIIINTCRAGKYANQAELFLISMGIPYHYFNKNCVERLEKYGVDCRKISADMYIDDKNLGGFPGWLTVYKEIRRMKL